MFGGQLEYLNSLIFQKKLKDNIEEDARDYEDLYIRLLKHTPKWN